jgi:hypothetical protein
MHHGLALPQRIVRGQRDKQMLRRPGVKLGLRNALPGLVPTDGCAHLRMIDISLPHRAAPPDLTAEQTPQRSEKQLIPFLSGRARQQQQRFRPASPASSGWNLTLGSRV